MVNITFGSSRLEASHESYEALVADIEEKLDLHPGSFSIHDDFGKVDDSLALQRILDSAVDGQSDLKVVEAPEWKKLREMEAKIELLVARCPVVDNAIADAEERSLKRYNTLAASIEAVEEKSALRGELSRAEMRLTLEDLDAKVSGSIAPLLQSVALQQMDLRVQLDSMQASLVSEDISLKINNGIAPMLQSMALQQMNLKDQIESIENFSCISCEELNAKVDGVDDVTKDLQKEMQMGQSQIKALQEGLQSLNEKPAPAVRGMSAMEQDLNTPSKSTKALFSSPGCDAEAYSSWLDGASLDMSPMAYSKKAAHTSLNSSAVPFARFMAPRQLDRLNGSRSLPHLPPVK